MRVICSDRHRLHAPEHDIDGGVAVPLLEAPPRVDQILSALRSDASFTFEEPAEHGMEPIEAIHDVGLISFIREASLSAGDRELFPDSFPHPRLREGMQTTLAVEPEERIGRLGYWCFDTGTPLVAGTYRAALASVDIALTVADNVLAGEKVSYGLCRPPGHHAARSVYGGFCFFNNAAIAAEYVLKRGAERVAVLDLDYHHGNGTQQIFYHRGEVLTVSLHADPRHAFPYFTGYADETGAGAGKGANLNMPLPSGTGDREFLEALDRGLEALTRFSPDVTVVSLGMDTYERDPLGDFRLTTDAYSECGRRVMAAAAPIVVLQEGGYFLPHLGENVLQWLRGALY